MAAEGRPRVAPGTRRQLGPANEAILRGVEKNRYMVFTSADGRLLHWIQRKFSPPYELAMRVAGASSIGSPISRRSRSSRFVRR